MRLRSFQLSDIFAVQQVWSLASSHEKEKQTLRVLTDQLARDRDLVIVAEEDNEVIGAIVGTIDGRSGFFYCLAVHPAHRNKKVGSQLVKALCTRFQRKGVTRMYITVDEGTQNLVPFYQRLGFTSFCRTRQEDELLAMGR
jgi:ribosomal-protein-alanine N-acetyltransferase